MHWLHSHSPVRCCVSGRLWKGLHCPHLIYDREGSGRDCAFVHLHNSLQSRALFSPEVAELILCESLGVGQTDKGSSLSSVTSQLRDPGLTT